MEGHTTKHVVNTPQNHQGHRKHSLRNCYSQEELKTKCSVVSWMHSWNRKRTLGENLGNLNKIWMLVENNVSVLAC